MNKILSKYNYIGHVGQNKFSPSKTVQDDCLTIREILVRFAGGQAVPEIARVAQYPDFEPDIDDFSADVDWSEPTSGAAYRDFVNSKLETLKTRKEDIERRIKFNEEQQKQNLPKNDAPAATE